MKSSEVEEVIAEFGLSNDVIFTSVDSSAIEKLKEFLFDEESLTGIFRVFVMGAGCSGIEYNFCIEDEFDEEDSLYEIGDGLVMCVDSHSVDFIRGARVKYKEDFSGSSFVIENDIVSASCSCSHSV